MQRFKSPWIYRFILVLLVTSSLLLNACGTGAMPGEAPLLGETKQLGPPAGVSEDGQPAPIAPAAPRAPAAVDDSAPQGGTDVKPAPAESVPQTAEEVPQGTRLSPASQARPRPLDNLKPRSRWPGRLKPICDFVALAGIVPGQLGQYNYVIDPAKETWSDHYMDGGVDYGRQLTSFEVDAYIPGNEDPIGNVRYELALTSPEYAQRAAELGIQDVQLPEHAWSANVFVVPDENGNGVGTLLLRQGDAQIIRTSPRFPWRQYFDDAARGWWSNYMSCFQAVLVVLTNSGKWEWMFSLAP